MNRKFVYLFLALLLPGLIFVFLKRFGKNQFDIPFFYKNSADSLNAICGTSYSNPYSLADSVLKKTGWRRAGATLFTVDVAEPDNKQLKRISDTFSRAEYSIIDINPRQLGAATYKRWTSCVFFTAPPWNLVLMDKE